MQGIRRVRFTTSHPNDFRREIVDAIDETPALCDHVHLPVQSGSTRILRAMRRTYTREEYLEKISWIRGARRPSASPRDIIVGFPGETELDFEESITLLEAVGYDGVFRLSIRPGRIRPRDHGGCGSRRREKRAARDSAGTPAPDSDRAQ